MVFSRMVVQSMMTVKQFPCYGACTVLSPRGKVPKVAVGNIRETGMGRHVPPGPPRPAPTRCWAQRRRSVLISFSEQGYGQCGPPIRVACAICSPSFVCGVRRRDRRGWLDLIQVNCCPAHSSHFLTQHQKASPPRGSWREATDEVVPPLLHFPTNKEICFSIYFTRIPIPSARCTRLSVLHACSCYER